jgi:hypothetical protein
VKGSCQNCHRTEDAQQKKNIQSSMPKSDIECFEDTVHLDAHPRLMILNRQLFYGEMNDCCAFDMHTLQWTQMPWPHCNRVGCGAAMCDGKLFLVGGKDRGEYLASIESCDLQTHLWEVFPPTFSLLLPRSSCAVVSRKKQLIVLGGYRGRALASVEICDVSSCSVSELPPMNTARLACGAVWRESTDEIIVLGGDQSIGYLTSGEVYSFSRRSWSPFPQPMANPRRDFGIVILSNNRLFVTGGRNSEGAVAATEIFDDSTNRWESVSPLTFRKASMGRCSATSIVNASNQGKVYVCLSEQMFVWDCETCVWSELPSQPLSVRNSSCFAVCVAPSN